ncbi:cold-shock protein [Planctomycetota bacterium]
MSRGTVKFFSSQKGFGFITPDDGSEDVFCHHTSIQMDGYKTLEDGQAVEYDVVEGPKGLASANVQILN